MAYSTTHLYPEDLNGTNPANLIVKEPYTLQAPGPEDYYFIIPKAAPFFVDSIKVYNAAGVAYVEGDDYQIGHQFIEAMDSTGRPIAGSIRFMRPTITGQVLVTYRTLGGNWGFSDTDILRELSNKLVNPLIRSWGDIAPLPYAFPPLPHDQRLDTLIGSKQINDALNRIADVLEATASGSTASHLVDYNNPHRVTKAQVGLGNVPNFAMATDVQHTDATRNDLFTNPRGVKLIVDKFAVVPLNAHIADRTNPHGVNKTQVGLGNVPNFPKATAAQAIDPTNDSTLMTPYTTSLLVQKLSSDPRLDQLIIDFNDHITAHNPHNITPAMIGTYTSQEIDQRLANLEKGGDAATFGGESPAQWVAKFPSVSDINTILQELYDVVSAATATMVQLNVDSPITDDDINTANAQLISWAFGDYSAYALYNSYNDGQIVASKSIGNGFPTSPVAELPGKWGTTVNGNYYIEANGGIRAWGSNPITIPTVYATATIGSNPKVVGIYPSKDYIIIVLENGRMMNVVRGTPVGNAGTLLKSGVDPWIVFVGNGMQDTRTIAIYEETTDDKWYPVGDASWVTAANAAITNGNAAGYSIIDVRIGTDTLVVISQSATDTRMWVYKIVYGTSISLNNVTSTTMVRNHTTGEVIPASDVRGVTQVAGSFTHSVLTKPIAPNSNLCDLLSFGDDSNGQLEIPASSAPFYSMGAGYGFTVTINRHHFAEFWGDSPDNSLIYTGGPRIIPA